MHLIEKNAKYDERPLRRSSNRPHCERQVTSNASVWLGAETKHAAGTVGPQPVFGLQSLRYYQRYTEANELKRRKGKRAEAHYVPTASHPQIERSLSQDYVESVKRKTSRPRRKKDNKNAGGAGGHPWRRRASGVC